MPASAAPDVVVVGGGIVGLGVAHRAMERGMAVTVVDPGDVGAWHVAAGMLAPVSEAEMGDEPHLALGLESAARWPAFAAELGVPLRAEGTMIVARDRDDAEALDRLHRFRVALGVEAERLLPTAARRREPALAPTVRLALDVPGDRAVDPRAVVAALQERVPVTRGRVARLLTAATAGRAAGTAPDAAAPDLGAPAAAAPDTAAPAAAAPAAALPETAAPDIAAPDTAASSPAVTGVQLDDGSTIEAPAVVLAAGAWTAQLDGLPEHARVPVRPVKGQVLRLRDPRGAGLVTRCIRTLDAYLVPRDDGRYVLGATMEERGWDASATAGGVFELLRDLSEVVPGILELELEDVLVGFRPGTPDNAPVLGPGALPGLHWATGHWRNGVLLTPATADAVAGCLAGEPLPDWAADARAGRFGAARDGQATPAGEPATTAGPRA